MRACSEKYKNIQENKQKAAKPAKKQAKKFPEDCFTKEQKSYILKLSKEFVLGKYIPQDDKIIFKESYVTKAIREGGAVVFEEIN